MSEENKRGTPHRGILLVITVAILLPVLYVLSIGPVDVFFQKYGTRPHPEVGELYLPVFWLHDHTPLRGPLDSYIKLCGVKDVSGNWGP